MSRYRRRERDWAYMAWVKTLRCCVAHWGGCRGPIEADHAGRRGLGQKAPDDTCIPLCQLHHRQRTDHSGPWRRLTRPQIRLILDQAIEATRAARRLSAATDIPW